MSAARHKKICSRDPKAGPGSCWWWWENCPEGVADCDLRRQRMVLRFLEEHGRALDVLVKEALG